MFTKHPKTRTAAFAGPALRLLLALLAAPVGLFAAVGAQAQTFPAGPAIAPVPVAPAQFDITGFMQDATLDSGFSLCPGLPVKDPRLAGGWVTLNGQRVVIPCNTILQMPAYTMTWADLFDRNQVPQDTTPNGSGLTLKEAVNSTAQGLLSAAPAGYNAALPTFELRAVGNIVNGQYTAGLVFISQQQLNSGQGVISCIDYATGELQVGGLPRLPGEACPQPSALPPGVARVRINDTVGRFGLSHGGPGSGAQVIEPGYDPRLTPDTDNPTMHAATGFPMCIPRLNPFTQGIDPECPQSNRPIAPNCRNFDPSKGLPALPAQSFGYCTSFVMDAPGAAAPAGVVCPGPGIAAVVDGTGTAITAAQPCPTDPTKQMPFEIGDNITFLGSLKSDANGPYVSAHTIEARVATYTQPNTKPAYVFVEEVLAGTAGLPVAGLAQEETARVRFVGFTTDPTNLVDLYALDQDPLSGAVTERLLGTESPIGNAVVGRFRTRANNNGPFLPPTRNYRAISRTLCADTTGPFVPCHLEGPGAASGAKEANTFANGLIAGQYLLPNFEFIFAENTNLGDPLVPNNFQDLPFLYCGSGPLDPSAPAGPGNPVVGQLDPAPWGQPQQDPIFASSLCPQARHVADPVVFPPVINPDTVVINAATWDNRQNKGKLNIVATTSRVPMPSTMFMTVTISTTLVPPTHPGGTANPITAQMVKSSDILVCGVATPKPCFALNSVGFIIGPGVPPGSPFLVPPTSITVRSSLGGTATASGAAITLR